MKARQSLNFSSMSSYFDQLLQSSATTSATRAAIEQRPMAIPAQPKFFSPEEFELFSQICARLGAPELGAVTAAEFDERLANGKGNGWRYAELPEDGAAIRLFIGAIAEARWAQSDAAARDEILSRARSGELETLSDQWPAKRFFGDLMAEVAEIYMSQPATQADAKYAGFADKPGWSEIKLNEKQAREPDQNGVISLEPQPLDFGKTEWDNFAPGGVAASGAPMQRFSNDEEVDALIIGLGAGGGPLLSRLARAGLKCVALEAGQWHDPRDFATDERAQNFLFWLDERLSAGKNAVAFGANNSGIGVGGSTLHYTAYTPRPFPDDFTLRTDFGVGNDWPIPYGELEPYLSEVEWFIGVSGPSPYPWGPPRAKGYPLAPLPVNAAGQIMKTGCDAIGLKSSPAPNAALSAPYYVEGVGWRAACSNRGFCQAGCSTGAKSSVDVTYIPLALQHGAEIRPNCYVTAIEKKDGKITGVVYQENGEEKRQKCRNLFLCAGAIETPRLLLLNDLSNSSGQVGKNFMAHPGMQLWATFDDEVRPYKGIPGALISQDTHRMKGVDFAGGYLLQSIGVMPVTYASQYARGEQKFGAELRDHLSKYNHVAGINILGDCLPYEHNHLELSDELDERGVRKPKLTFTAGDNENAMDSHALKTMTQIFEAAGAKEMWHFQRHAHVIGTAMMGTDASKSVVNPDGKSHEIPNLYISDNSTFPTALDVNPALTIMALSLRTADRFLANR